MAGEPEVKIYESLLWLLLLSSLLVAALPTVKAQGTSNCVFFGYWQDGAWHSVSQVVAGMNSSVATGWNQQRNCFIDQQGYYWVFAYEWTLKFVGITSPNSYEGFSSPDGVTWSAGQRLLSAPDGATYFDHHFQLHQGLDIAFQSVNQTGSYNKGMAFICLNDMNYWYRLSFNAGTMTREDWNIWNSIVNHNSVSYRYANQSAYWINIENMYHPELSLNRAFGISENQKTFNGWTYAGTAQGSFSLTGGETVTLSWNSTHSYYVTVLGNNSVCYGYCSAPSTVQNPSTSMGFSTRAGIDALVGCSDPEVLGWEQGKLHILYVKDSPEDLCHRSFDGSSWSSEEVVATGTNMTSPVLSTDGTGLLASWIQDNTIHYRYFNGASWETVQHLVGVTGGSSNWENPRYLSASQMPYGGKILMTWTGEGLAPIPLPPTNTGRWIGIAAPHVYAAITIWSLAMIIGVGAALSKGVDVADLPYLVLMGLGILICLFVALAIMSGFLNL
jgi:hypothetical protein